MLEAQPLHRVVQFDVDAEVVGIELELVVAEPAGLVDIHDQVGDVAVVLDFPVAIAGRVGLVIDDVSAIGRLCPDETVSFVMAGLDPAIHVLPIRNPPRSSRLDARLKPGMTAERPAVIRHVHYPAYEYHLVGRPTTAAPIDPFLRPQLPGQ